MGQILIPKWLIFAIGTFWMQIPSYKPSVLLLPLLLLLLLLRNSCMQQFRNSCTILDLCLKYEIMDRFWSWRCPQCTRHTVHCTLTLPNVQGTLHTAHCTLHTAICILYNAHNTARYSLYIAYYMLCTAHNPLHCKLHTTHCTLHFAGWTMYIAHYWFVT